MKLIIALFLKGILMGIDLIIAQRDKNKGFLIFERSAERINQKTL